MMLYPAMRDLLNKVPSRYKLVNVVAHRAREISTEAELAGEPLDEKSVSIAIQEVADGAGTEPAPVRAKGRGEARGTHDGQGGGGQGDLRHRPAL